MNRLLTFAGNFLLILAAVICATGVLISAFSFDVNFRTLILVWLPAAFLASALSALRRGIGPFVLLPLGAAAIVWKWPEIAEGAKWTVNFITAEYHKWLYVSVLFEGAAASKHELTLFFAAAGLALIFLLSVTFLLRHSALFVILFTIPFVLPAFVLVNFPPEPLFLLGLLAVFLTLIISASMHPDGNAVRGRIVFPAIALSLLLLGAAYLIAPQDGYERDVSVKSLDARLRGLAMQAGFDIKAQSGAGWPDGNSADGQLLNTQYVSVADAGPRGFSDQSLLEITSARAGTFYLAGYSMQSFDGRAWQVNSDELRHSFHPEIVPGTLPSDIALLHNLHYPDKALPVETMTVVRTGDRSEIFYEPYFSMRGYYSSLSPAEAYTISFIHAGSRIFALAEELQSDFGLGDGEYAEEANAEIKAMYTEIDPQTAEGLQKIARDAGIYPYGTRVKIAGQVAEYISSAASYTLFPYVTPGDEDFALYFLKTSKQGYCIHFATAAALMLRALDVPARFTSGFTVEVADGEVGQPVTVTDRQAHAWVEVYYDDIGWVPLEVTPPDTNSGAPFSSPYTAAGNDAQEPAQDPDLPDNSSGSDDGQPLQIQEPSTPSGAQAEPEPVGRGAEIWIAAVCAAVCVTALILRPYIARRRRDISFSQEDTNAAVICAWRYISRLSRRKRSPGDIEALALKARFSQHIISEDERAAVLGYAAKLADETYRQSRPVGRFWMRYVRGL